MKSSKNKDKFFNIARRDFIAKAALGVFTVTIAAAYASNFFTNLAMPIRIKVWGVAVLVTCIGFLVAKDKEDKNEVSV